MSFLWLNYDENFINNYRKCSVYLNQLSAQNDDWETHKNVLISPIPKGVGVLRLTLIRKNNGFNRIYPKYSLFLGSNNEFLLNSKKMVGNKTSNYLISMKEGEFNKKKDSFIAKLRSQESKNKYIIFDNGKNFKKNLIISRNKIRNEIG